MEGESFVVDCTSIYFPQHQQEDKQKALARYEPHESSTKHDGVTTLRFQQQQQQQHSDAAEQTKTYH